MNSKTIKNARQIKGKSPPRKDNLPLEKSGKGKDKLACLFYLLASIYYSLQLIGKFIDHVTIPIQANLTDFFNDKMIMLTGQIFILIAILFKKPK